MRRLGMAIIGAMMALVVAGTATAQNQRLDEGLSNKPPYPKLQFVEKAPRMLEVAAIVDRGGAPQTQDQEVFALAVDRAIRYAARLAEQRKAPQFDVLFEGRQYTHQIFTGSVQQSTSRQMMARAIVALRDADAPPANEGVRFVTRDVLARAPERTIFLARRGFNVR